MIMEMLKYDDTENGSNHWDVTLPVSGQKRTYESMKGDGGGGGSSSSSSSSMSESGSGSDWIGPLVTGTKLFREEGEGVVDWVRVVTGGRQTKVKSSHKKQKLK